MFSAFMYHDYKTFIFFCKIFYLSCDLTDYYFAYERSDVTTPEVQIDHNNISLVSVLYGL